ncbi:MAG: hypothetical protein ACTSUE_06760 [Promethearchaeota archaeon]
MMRPTRDTKNKSQGSRDSRRGKKSRNSGGKSTYSTRRSGKQEGNGKDYKIGRDNRDSRANRDRGKYRDSRTKRDGKDDGDNKDKKPYSHWIDFATKEEKDLIHEEINMFGRMDEPWQALVAKNDVNIFVYRKKDLNEVHLLPRVGKVRFKKLMGNPGLEYFGLFAGYLLENEMRLSMEGASEVARNGGVSANFVKLTDEGEKSFLYGNDLKKETLLEVPPDGITHDRGICLVLNSHGEFIGIGRLACQDPTFESVQDEDIIITNLVDNGLYLRKGF